MPLATRRGRVLIATVLAALLYLPALGAPPLWEPDEGRYAEIAREMLASGDFITPRNNYVRYFEKPPLAYWMTAAAMYLFGENEFAARLPAALASVAQVAVIALLAESMLGATAGFIAALALATFPLFIGFARFATLDPLLAFFVTAAVAAFYAAAHAGDFHHAAARNWFIVSAAMLALGTLAKGPVALVLGGGIALAWLIWERRTAEIRSLPWIPAILIYLAIAAPWFALVASRNPGFLEFFFIREHLLRYHQFEEHARPLWFFIPILIGGAWPWCLFAPLGYRSLRDDPACASGFRLLMAWFLFVLIFFSLPQSKLGGYILPALPPLAIVCGCGVARLPALAADAARRLLLWFGTINLGAAAVALIALIVMRSRISAAALTSAALIILAPPLGAALAYALWRRARAALPVAAAIVGAIALGTIGAEGIRADVASVNSYRKLSAAIGARLEPGCTLASYRHFVQSLPFYTRTRTAIVAHRGELAPWSRTPDARASFIHDDAAMARLWSSGRCVILVINRTDLARVVPMLTPHPAVVGCEGKKFALSNRPLNAATRAPAGCDLPVH
jgi:4-amino-4-deoxy-L-arabinose transferase-like glycosyltransferase